MEEKPGEPTHRSGVEPWPAAFTLQLLRGMGLSATDIGVNTLIQREVPAEMIGRVLAPSMGPSELPQPSPTWPEQHSWKPRAHASPSSSPAAPDCYAPSPPAAVISRHPQPTPPRGNRHPDVSNQFGRRV